MSNTLETFTIGNYLKVDYKKCVCFTVLISLVPWLMLRENTLHSLEQSGPMSTPKRPFVTEMVSHPSGSDFCGVPPTSPPNYFKVFDRCKE